MDIEDFLKTNLADLVGLRGAPEDIRRDFLRRASHFVLEAIADRIDETLSEEKREEFYRLFQPGASEEEKQAFLKAYVPNFEEIVGEETARVKLELVKAATKLRNETPESPLP